VSGGDRSQANAALIAALLAGSTIEKAAKGAGVSEATARRRLRDPGFVRELNSARRELVAAITAQLAGIATEALATLDDLISNPETPQPQRLGGVREALRHLAVLSESADSAELGERLERIEKRLGLAIVDDEAAA
jgi:hypothetical protein